jgi:predicted DNA-binding protein
MARKAKTIRTSKGDHCLNLYVSWELKERIRELAKRFDRPIADIARSVLKIGIPLFEGLSEAEETVIRENVRLLRRLRKVKSLKDI